MATISTSGISPGQIIHSEHLLRVINALDGVNPIDIIITGSLSVSGSTSLSGSTYLKGIPNTSRANVITYDPTTGQLSYLNSASLGVTMSVSIPGGTNTQIQYNSGSVLAATSSFTFNYNLQSLQQGNNVLASSTFAHAQGNQTTASGQYSHAEGATTQAKGLGSHAEGINSIASGSYSHAEGSLTQAIGSYSHAEGESTKTIGEGSHAEGYFTTASGGYSHAEGRGTVSIGAASHAEGQETRAIGDYSHAEGNQTVASGEHQHVQGQFNISSSVQSAFIIGNGSNDSNRSNLVFAAGNTFQVTGSLQVSGSITGSLFGTASHVLNQLVTSSLIDSYIGTRIFPTSTTSNGFAVNRNVNGAVGLVIKNSDTSGNGAYSAVSLTPSGSWYDSGSAFIYFNGGYHVSSLQNTGGIYSAANTNILLINNKDFSVQTGNTISTLSTKFKVSGSGNVYIPSGNLEITGSLNVTNGITGSLFGTASWAVSASWAPSTSATSGGSNTQIQFNSGSVFAGTGSFTFNYQSQSLQQGNNVIASGDFSHAEGIDTQAIGIYSHAEGAETQAIGEASHAEGSVTISSGSYSHAEGDNTVARGQGSHAEGVTTLALSDYSHAEGGFTTASGDYSHAEGANTVTLGIGSHAEGYYTVASGDYQHVQGQYNISSSAQSAFIIGNGTADNARRNLVFASGSEFQITGSLLINDIIALTPRTTTPTPVEGMIIASGSVGASVLYYYNGTTWNALF